MNNIHWYPGHMKKATEKINDYIKLVDVVIIVLDARAPFTFINDELDNLVKNKLRLIVLTKIDLADKDVVLRQIDILKKRFDNCISINNNDPNSKKIISLAINALAKDKKEKEIRKGMKPQPTRAMIIGVPNVGKSSFINRLSNRNATKVANKPAYTRGASWIKVNNEFELLDTPGVLPTSYKQSKKAYNLAVLGSIDDNILPISDVVNYLITYLKDNYPSSLKDRYGIENIDNYEQVIKDICSKRGLLKKGEYDFERGELLLLKEFRAGYLGRISLEKEDA